MAKTRFGSINAKTISVNGVPAYGSAAPSGRTTNFGDTEYTGAVQLNGVTVAGVLPAGERTTNFGDVNFTSLSASGGVTPAPFASIQSNGWAVDYAATPGSDLPLATFSVTRQGFDATGAAVTNIADTLVATKRIRQVYPNQALYTTTSVALSDYLYSTDTVAGRDTSGITEISPKPDVAWAQEDRQVIGNTLVVDVVALHRNGRSGKPVAFVSGTATDGTTTVTASTATPIVLNGVGDQNAVIGYRLTFNLSTLTDNAQVTVNAKVYPWIGGVASIADSSTGTAGNRGFVPQVFYRSTSLFNNPPQIFIDATNGTDATVLASGQTAGGLTVVAASTAGSANPVKTLVGAMAALKAATSVTGGFTTGCIINVKASGGTLTHVTGIVNTTYQNGGEVVVRSDPAGATATLAFGGGNFNWYQPYLRLKNIALARTAGAFGIGSTITQLALENVTLDNNNVGTAFTSAPALLACFIRGITVTNIGSAFNWTGVNAELRLLRGFSYTAPSPTPVTSQFDLFVVLGCSTFGLTPVRNNQTGHHPTGTIIAFNKWLNLNDTTTVVWQWGNQQEGTALGYAAGTNWNMSVWIVQNVFEKTSVTNSVMIRFSGDTTANGSMVGGGMWNNTFTGYRDYGRNNMFYDEDPASYRVHRLMSMRGNIYVQMNVKGDVFVSDGTHTGDFAHLHGVGSLNEFSQFINANNNLVGNPAGYAQMYAGKGALIGTDLFVRQDPLFTNYQGTGGSGGTASAGNGGGTYTLANGSPCIGVATAAEEALPFDLAGVARTRGAIGAYA